MFSDLLINSTHLLAVCFAFYKIFLGFPSFCCASPKIKSKLPMSN